MLDTLLGFSLTLPAILTFLSACLAIIAACTRLKTLATGLLVLTLAFATYYGFLQIWGLAAVVVLLISAVIFNRSNNKFIGMLTGCMIFILAIAMLLHLVAGFVNPKVIDAIQISQGATTFTKYLNLDKIILGTILLIFVVPQGRRLFVQQVSIPLIAFIFVTGICLILAVITGLVSFEPKFPTIAGGWLLTNLFFTCYVEEAFFRGFIQVQLQKISNKNYWPTCVIVISGVLFGLAHLPGGAVYTLIASLTGSCYAYAYWRSNNIMLPILMHFSFNCIHFFCFTYPFLSQ